MPPILYKYNPRSTKNRIILRTFACKYCKNNGRTYRTYHKSQRTTDGPFHTESHGNPERHARLLLCRKPQGNYIRHRKPSGTDYYGGSRHDRHRCLFLASQCGTRQHKGRNGTPSERSRSHPRSRPRGHRFRRYIPGRRGLYVCGRIRRSSHQ